MASTSASVLMMSTGTSEQSGALMENSNMNISSQPPSQLSQNSSQGPVSILWDIENCPVPSDVRAEDVAGNIRMALRVHPIIKGAVTLFSAYGDFNAFPRRLREGCQRTGVKLVDVPNGRKDAADKAILVDMFLFALDNPPPSSIMLISGDVDFAPALHILGQRGYTVILVIPSGVGVSSALSNAGRFVWDWPSVARGEGFLTPSRNQIPSHVVPAEVAGYLMWCHMNGNPNGMYEDEAILYRGMPQSFHNSRDFSMMPQPFSEYNTTSLAMPCLPSSSRSHSLPCGLNDASTGYVGSCGESDLMFVQPGDLNGLKQQLEKLLELCGGCLPLARVPAEYLKTFGRPLYVADYGACKLVSLIKKTGDTMAIDGKGQKKFVYLRNSRPGPSAPPIALAKKDKKMKGHQEVNNEAITGGGSSDELSDEDRVVVDEQDEQIAARCETARYDTDDVSLEQFKYELQEILVSYSCRIFLHDFEAIYQQRYKRQVDYQRFGVIKLEELVDKVIDVAVLYEEPGTKKKILVAVGY